MNGKERLERWQAELRGASQRKAHHQTLSWLDVDPLYAPEQPDEKYFESLGLPGEYPFTRGVYPSMYRGRLWTMRMFAGFGSPEDTNARFKYLLEAGQTGLSTAFDMPTLMGYDPDHAMSMGEVGKEGVAVASVEDMERLFDGIPLGEVSTSMTINAPAIVLLCMYAAVAERQGYKLDKLRGTTQNDILKEFIAQKEWICPPNPSMRIIRDMMVFCTERMPLWHPISISGYHIREAGASAVQELAFTLADGIGYVQAGIEAGLDVDRFGPRLSFFFDVHNDFFEEIAKLRAARRIWARTMKERFGAKNPRAMLLRTHCQTAGVSLTAQQPYNNVVRTALQALAAVLGGTQSLHTNSLDETYALPTEAAASLALRTQQLIAEETGVTNTIDPLGGSWFIESMTDRIEEEALAYIHRIDEMGGIVAAIEAGYPQMEIAESAYRFQSQVEEGEQRIVGVNVHQEADKARIPLLRIDPEVERIQKERIADLRRRRDPDAAARALDQVRKAALSGDSHKDNLMAAVLQAVKAKVTVGELSDCFREEFGVYSDPAYL